VLPDATVVQALLLPLTMKLPGEWNGGPSQQQSLEAGITHTS
jgi:hypothetical protein